MHEKSLYENAHLMVAAIRIAAHLKRGGPPGIREICDLLKISAEEALFFIRRLESEGIVESIDQAGTPRFFIRDIMAMEKLPKTQNPNAMSEEIEAFQVKRSNRNLEIENFKKQQEEKKKALFAELNKKLKVQEPDRKNPEEGRGEE